MDFIMAKIAWCVKMLHCTFQGSGQNKSKINQLSTTFWQRAQNRKEMHCWKSVTCCCFSRNQKKKLRRWTKLATTYSFHCTEMKVTYLESFETTRVKALFSAFNFSLSAFTLSNCWKERVIVWVLVHRWTFDNIIFTGESWTVSIFPGCHFLYLSTGHEALT